MNSSTAGQEFERRLTAHLTHFYRDTVGLDRLEERIKYRAQEEVVEEARLRVLLERLGISADSGIKMLVVGSGWGGMCVAASRLGIDVYGIDIDQESIGISRLRFLRDGREHTPVHCAAAEHLPFRNDSFDLVYCFSVVEHVSNVDATVSEIYRVLKPDGYAYIQTQNFNIPWEPHYKVLIPTFLGHRVCKAILKLRRRNPDYLDTVNFIRGRAFERLVRRSDLKILDHWNIVRHTSAKMPVRQDKQARPVRRGMSEKINRGENFVGQALLRLWPLIGVRNVHMICQKTDTKLLLR